MDGHGGELSVYSPGEGMGSTFTMRLPLEAGASDLEMRSLSVYNVPTKNANNAKNIKLDEDNENAQQDRPVFSIPVVESDHGNAENNNEQLRESDTVNGHEKESQPQLPSSGHAATKEKEDIYRRCSESNPLRILIVDDSALNRKMTAKMFAKNAMCDQAADGQIAVNMVMVAENRNSERILTPPLMTPSGTYDVILMDYQMPNMDGPTAIRELRRLGFSGLIFGLTGNAIECDKMEMMAAGADKVFIKPFDTGMFWEAVNATRKV